KLVRIQFHQTIQVILSDDGRSQPLAHCDRAFVCLNDSNAFPETLMVTRICRKVYHHRSRQNDSFAALLEVNVLDTLEKGKSLEPKYCFLVAVASLAGMI